MTQGLYFHIPFCIRKCPYCDFLSYPVHQHDHHRDELIRAMERNIVLWKENTVGIDSVYFGGGTPSLLTTEEISVLLECSFDTLAFKNDCEITIEANPGTVNKGFFSRISENGVNRVSFGAQTFNDSTLKKIGRIHTSEQAVEAVKNAHDAGIANVSVDLMIGLPGQTVEEIEKNIRIVSDLEVTHVSCYDLTIAEGTLFGDLFEKNELNLPDEDWMLKTRDLIDNALNREGFERYEISNYAKSGYECRHNLHYWHNDPYIGVGPGAVGKFGRIRYQNAADIDTYIKQIKNEFKWAEVIEQADDYDETFNQLMLGTRLKNGVVFADLLSRLSDAEKNRWIALTKELTSLGLVKIKEGRLIPTRNGWCVHNAWLQRFLKNHDD